MTRLVFRTVELLAFVVLTKSGFCTAAPVGLELRLGAQAITGNLFLLDLGYQVEKTPLTVRIGIRNTHASPLQLDMFKFSENLGVRWVETNDPRGLVTRSTLAAGELRDAEVKIMPSNDPEFPYVAIFARGKPLLIIGIGYALAPRTYTVQTSGQYWSGYSSKYSSEQLGGSTQNPPYELCTGPAPFHYHLDPSKIGLDGKSVPAPDSHAEHPRNCKSFMVCKPGRADNADVCYKFDIQGHFLGASFFAGWDDIKEWVKVEVRLHAGYDLDPSIPSLSSLKQTKH